jgi:hypothetical protein
VVRSRPLGFNLLKRESLAEMQQWKNLTNSWNAGWSELGIVYGLATYRCGEFERIAVPGTSYFL